jgi:hypothetical protein
MRLDLEHLLSRGRLGGPTRERILRRALRDAGIGRLARPAALSWRALAALATLGAAAVAIRAIPANEALRSKDGSSSSRAAVVPAIECTGLDARRCSRQDMIVFRFDGCAGGAYVAAFAQRAPSGEPLWFFPLSDGTQPALSTECGPQVLPQAIRASELGPGRYQVHVVLTRRRAAKDEILAGASRDVVATATSTLDVAP